MAFEQREYRDHIAEASQSAANDRKTNLRMAEQASVKAQALTRDPHWDWFLSFIQAAVEETEKQRNSLLTQLSDSRMVNIDQIMAVKLALAQCTGRLEAWTSARDLPKDLFENGEKAIDLLSRLETPE